MPQAPLPERLTAQALAGEPLRSAEQVAERLLAVQAQDLLGARLAVRARTPADDRDLARWAGLPLRDARAGLATISKQLVEREDGLVDLKKTPPPAPIPPPRLLGPFDPVLLGWTSREEIVGPHKMLVTTNGIFRPFAMVDGRAVATWRLAAGKLTIEPLGSVKKKDAAALEADAARVLEFLRA